jgi:hypothetical protein
MDITLNNGTPTADATELTEGAAYSVYHRGGCTVSLYIGGAWTQVYQSSSNGPGCHIPILPGTGIRFALASGSTESAITLVAKAA